MYREIAQQGTDYITNALAFVTALMWNNFIKNYILKACLYKWALRYLI